MNNDIKDLVPEVIDSDIPVSGEKKIIKKSNSRIIRVLYILAGGVSLALGCVGIVLPVLPTVPFFLATAFCFAKGSQRFHDWFLASKMYKKYMSGFAEHKSMSIKGELLLLTLVSTMLITATYFANVLAMTIIIPLLIACKFGYFIFKVKPVTKPELNDMKKLKEDVAAVC